jgi:hypothetical protein
MIRLLTIAFIGMFYLGEAQIAIVDVNDLKDIDRTISSNVIGKVLMDKNFDGQSGIEINPVDPPFFPNFPIYNFPGTSVRGGVVHDLDQDGENELIYCFGNQVYVYNLDGALEPFWPTSMDHNTIGAPAIGDIDGDGFDEVVVTTDFVGISGELYAFEHTGELVPNFPISYDGAPMRTPVLANLDHDDPLEIVVNIRMWPDAFVTVYKGDASIVPGWPQQLDYIPGAPCAVGDITGDGEPEVIAVSYWSIYAFYKYGELIEGFPFTPQQDVRAFSYSSPVLADIDEDGMNEIVIGGTTDIPQAQNGGVYVINSDGSLVDGWPKYATSWIFAPVSVADLTGNGSLDILVGDQILSPTPANAMYGWDKDGNALPGFPISQQDAINTQAMIAELDNDGFLEFIFEDNFNEGQYHLYNHDGTEMGLFTLNPNGSTFFNNPTLADADGDGDLDIAAGIGHIQQQTGDLYLWDTEVVYEEDMMALPVLQYNNRHTGLYGDYDWLITNNEEYDTHENEIRIFPNPFLDKIQIQSFSVGSIQLFLYNVHGSLVKTHGYSANGNHTEAVDLSDLIPGVYFYRMVLGNSTVRGKIICE